jgi:antitoxin ParD1/3/4
MSALREMQITLPADLAERVRDKMQSGRYASENEVIAESLAALEDRETEIENWLANDVKPAFDRWAADPKRSIPLDEAFASLERRISGSE